MIRWSRRFVGGLLGACLLLLPTWGAAQSFSSGSTGADGPFNPTCSPTPCTVTVALPPSGVFNFTTITIPSGVTVALTRNAANTPAILLATGNVTISGTLDVSGSNGSPLTRPGLGGPGGFEGGKGADSLTQSAGGYGLGPGGGRAGVGWTAGGGGGSYGSGGGGGGPCTNCTGPPLGTGGAGGPTYGTAALQPLLGGSGGGGGGAFVGSGPTGGGGGGGGGAILLASSTSINLGASFGPVAVRANGGAGAFGSGTNAGGGGGSGGAIRLIANTVSGSGQLMAQGSNGALPNGGSGGLGRIRVEASTLTYNGSTFPSPTTSLPQAVFPPSGNPSLVIASVGGLAAPATPVGSILAAPDILLPLGTTNPVPVTLTASNIPLGTTIQVTATPQSGTPTSAISTGLSGTLASSSATATLTLSLTQVSVLTATATFPLVASAGSGPIYAEGEEVKWVRVAASLVGASRVVFITASGKEVPAEQIGWRW